LKTSVKIFSEIEECVFEIFDFENTVLFYNYVLGDDSLTFEAPQIKMAPDCGYVPKIMEFSIFPYSLPDGFTKE
jgi:hypothetical protein